MLSCWTNFLTEGGEKPWRNREAEFEADLSTRDEMLSKWNEGWACFISTLESIQTDDLDRTIYILNEGHTVTDAIQRQMAHYPMHVGQIVYIGKLLKDDDWKSLSITKGESVAFNDDKFSKEKNITHFTEKS